MKKITTTLLMVLMTMTFAFGQTQNATTENGKKVILFQDGTWKYEEAKKDTTLTTATNDCSQYIETTEDKMTGDKSTSAKETIIVSTDGGKKGFGIFLMQSSRGGSIFSIQAVGAGSCIDEGAKINILFTDGSKLELINASDFNCKGNATVYFGGSFGKTNQLKELQTKKIQTMRVWTSDSFVEKDFTKENSNDFFQIVHCLTK